MRHLPTILTSGFLLVSLLACGQAYVEDDPNTSQNPTPSGGGCAPADDLTCQVFVLVNQERTNAGVDPLGYSAQLARAAQDHAVDMVDQNYFDHNSLDGRDFGQRAKDAGYPGFPTGENIAAGQRTAEAVMQSWMNSNGHRRNILAAGSREIGIGFHQNRWVQVFGSGQ